ncbi:hypothetical protein HZC30_04305 [Candidatus Woesearchaeota archaeon]|nr:hypothetical protein [Candidatus Woesearchaeota archaeon]
MKRTLPFIRIREQEWMDDAVRPAVLEGICYLLQFTGEKEPNLQYSRADRTEDYRNADGSLKPYKSVDWYRTRGGDWKKKTGELNADAILSALCERTPRKGGLWSPRGSREPYKILVVQDKLYSPKNERYVNGIAQEWKGAIITSLGARKLVKERFSQYFRHLAMHEMGHVLGLVPKERTEEAVDNGCTRNHCTNSCAMRNGSLMEKGLLNGFLTPDKNTYPDYLCSRCQEDLRGYFQDKS